MNHGTGLEDVQILRRVLRLKGRKEWLGEHNSPTCETAVTLRVLRNLRSRATKAEGAAAVALVKLVR